MIDELRERTPADLALQQAVEAIAPDRAEELKNAVAELARSTALSADEAAAAISAALVKLGAFFDTLADLFTAAFSGLANVLDQLSEVMFPDPPPTKLQRKNRRERAQAIEARYRVMMKQYERAGPYRRIYKPP